MLRFLNLVRYGTYKRLLKQVKTKQRRIKELEQQIELLYEVIL